MKPRPNKRTFDPGVCGNTGLPGFPWRLYIVKLNKIVIWFHRPFSCHQIWAVDEIPFQEWALQFPSRDKSRSSPKGMSRRQLKLTGTFTLRTAPHENAREDEIKHGRHSLVVCRQTGTTVAMTSDDILSKSRVVSKRSIFVFNWNCLSAPSSTFHTFSTAESLFSVSRETQPNWNRF